MWVTYGIVRILAAGPLEDYVNHVVAKHDVKEAHWIMAQDCFKDVIENHGVWGDIDKIRYLAQMPLEQSRSAWQPGISALQNHYPVGITAIVSFWCHVFVPELDEFKKGYDAVMERLANPNKRKRMIAALKEFTPDEQAATQLNVIIKDIHA